jgi:hypothetical protein
LGGTQSNAEVAARVTEGMIDMLMMLLNGVLRWGFGRTPVIEFAKRTTPQLEIARPLSLSGYRKAKFRPVVLVLLAVFMAAAHGCAFHHYDKATGTEHIWGFGHLKMKITPPFEGLQTIVRGTDVLGLSLGIGKQQNYLTAGWHRTQRLDVIAENTAIRYEWPDSDFAKVRVGSKFPFQPALEIPDSNEKSESEL